MPENILTLAEAVKWRKNLRAAGKKVVVTNGCFDLLHHKKKERCAFLERKTSRVAG